MTSIRVGIVEDNKTISTSLVSSIELIGTMSLAFVAGSVEESIEIISDPQFEGVDIILQDIGLPGMNGIEGLPIIKDLLPDVDIIMLTTYDETEKIFAALCHGARSYISKKTSLKVIMDSIVTVYNGGAYMSPSIARKLVEHLNTPKVKSINDQLTSRQMQVVSGISEGLSYKMLADRFGISIDTVRSHIKKIYKILEINSKIELVNIYRKSNG